MRPLRTRVSVDCIEMVEMGGPETGWAAAGVRSRRRRPGQAYCDRTERRSRLAAERADERDAAARDKIEHLDELTIGLSADDQTRKRAVIQAALERARRARAAQGESGP